MKIEILEYSSLKPIYESMKIPRKSLNISDVPEKIFRWGHWSVLEHSYMSARISGISRSCANQLTRQRIGVSFTQESQRYVDPVDNYDEWYVIPPTIKENSDSLEIYSFIMHMIGSNYYQLLDSGVPKEDARFVLPMSCKTTIVWTFNLSSLIWFLEKRLDLSAQWEIRQLANQLYKLVSDIPEWHDFIKYWSLGARR